MTSNGNGLAEAHRGSHGRSLVVPVVRDASEEMYLNTLQPLDKDWVSERLSKPPFVEIEGVTNVRTLGGYASKVTLPGSAKPTNTVIRSKLLYRSGEVSGITDKGMPALLLSRELSLERVCEKQYG